jgi:hypothetical protein
MRFGDASGVTVLLALLVAVHVPPRAYLDTGSTHVPLAISSWCWGRRCGAPIARSAKRVIVPKGATLRAELEFVPSKVTVAIVGTRVPAVIHGRQVSWRATRPGGLTLRAENAKGWVTYVGRLALRVS